MELRSFISCLVIQCQQEEDCNVKLRCCEQDDINWSILFTKFVASSPKNLASFIFLNFDCIQLSRFNLFDSKLLDPLKQILAAKINIPLKVTQNINQNQSQNVQINSIKCDTLSSESSQRFPINVSEIVTEKSSQKINRIEKHMKQVKRQMDSLKAEQDQIKQEGVSKIEKNGRLTKQQKKSFGQRILQTATKLKIAIERMKQLRKQLEEVIEDEEQENDQNQRNSTECSTSEQQNDYQQI